MALEYGVEVDPQEEQGPFYEDIVETYSRFLNTPLTIEVAAELAGDRQLTGEEYRKACIYTARLNEAELLEQKNVEKTDGEELAGYTPDLETMESVEEWQEEAYTALEDLDL